MFTYVIYGAKVELLAPAPILPVGAASNGSSPWGKMISKITKTDNILNAPDGYNSAVLAKTFGGGSAG